MTDQCHVINGLVVDHDHFEEDINLIAHSYREWLYSRNREECQCVASVKLLYAQERLGVSVVPFYVLRNYQYTALHHGWIDESFIEREEAKRQTHIIKLRGFADEGDCHENA
jgi:hypothetical protein